MHNSIKQQQQRFTNSFLLHEPVTLRHGINYNSTYALLDNDSKDSCIFQSTADYQQLEDSQSTEELFIDIFRISLLRKLAIIFATSHFPKQSRVKSSWKHTKWSYDNLSCQEHDTAHQASGILDALGLLGRIESRHHMTDQVRQYNVRIRRGIMITSAKRLALFAHFFLLHSTAPTFKLPL